jgi:hypothetical protein
MNTRTLLIAAGALLALAGVGCHSQAGVSLDSNMVIKGAPAASANIDAAVRQVVDDSDAIDRSQGDEESDQDQVKADDAELNAYSENSYDLQ